MSKNNHQGVKVLFHSVCCNAILVCARSWVRLYHGLFLVEGLPMKLYLSHSSWYSEVKYILSSLDKLMPLRIMQAALEVTYSLLLIHCSQGSCAVLPSHPVIQSTNPLDSLDFVVIANRRVNYSNNSAVLVTVTMLRERLRKIAMTNYQYRCCAINWIGIIVFFIL